MKSRVAALLTTTVIAVCVVALAPLSAFAQAAPAAGAAAPAAGAYKIGIVELQTVMDQYNKQNDEVAKLEKDAAAKEATLKAKWDQFEPKKKAFDTERPNLDEATANSKEAELRKEFLALKSDMDQAQNELDSSKQMLKRTLLQDILKAVEVIGNQENYHLVLESDPNTRTGVLYSSSALNMTQKVVEYLNKQYGPAKSPSTKASSDAAKSAPKDKK